MLELGSGGFDVLYANLTRGLGLRREEGAHVMALPYTPGQVARAARRGGRPLAERSTACRSSAARCTARSRQCAPRSPACRSRTSRSAAVRSPSRSRTRFGPASSAGSLETAIAVAPCFDGDVDCVTTASALAWAERTGLRRGRLRDRPRDRRHGHAVRARRPRAADAANAAAALGGRPVLTVRASRGRPARTPPRRLAPHASPCSTCAWGRSSSPGRRRDARADGWEDACAGLPLRTWAAGPRRTRVLRAPRSPPGCRTWDARVMEERRLGPVVGLGTWNTFDDDESLARRIVDAALAAGIRNFDSSPMYGGASALAARARRPPRRGDRADEDLDAVARGGAAPAGRSARWFGRVEIEQVHNLVPGSEHLPLARGRMWRRADREARRHPLLAGRRSGELARALQHAALRHASSCR